MLSLGTNVNAIDTIFKISALHCTSNDGRKDMIEFLLANAADINLRTSNEYSYTPLIVAAISKHVEVGKIFLLWKQFLVNKM